MAVRLALARSSIEWPRLSASIAQMAVEGLGFQFRTRVQITVRNTKSLDQTLLRHVSKEHTEFMLRLRTCGFFRALRFAVHRASAREFVTFFVFYIRDFGELLFVPDFFRNAGDCIFWLLVWGYWE